MSAAQGGGRTGRRLHPCPGRCGAQVPYERLACPPCWARLPREMRLGISAAYKRRWNEPLRHVRTVSAALAWYRAEKP